MLRRVFTLRLSQLGCEPQPADRGDVLRACADPGLLAASLDDGMDSGVVRADQGARTLGAIDLVGGDRDRVDAERLHVDLDLAQSLHGVDVDRSVRCLAADDPREFADGEDAAELIVRKHLRHQDRVGPHPRFER